MLVTQVELDDEWGGGGILNYEPQIKALTNNYTFLQRKRKTESPPDSSEGAACTSHSSSSSPETDGTHDCLAANVSRSAEDLPAEKRVKLDSVAATDSSVTNSLPSDGSSKKVNKTSKLISTRQNSATSSSNNYKMANGGSNSTLRAGSSASVVVKKATKELSSTFKSATKDPNARDAYKALFHSKDKERPKEKTAHWVTFFPYH